MKHPNDIHFRFDRLAQYDEDRGVILINRALATDGIVVKGWEEMAFEVPMKSISSPADLLVWIITLSEEKWFTGKVMAAFVREVLRVLELEDEDHDELDDLADDDSPDDEGEEDQTWASVVRALRERRGSRLVRVPA